MGVWQRRYYTLVSSFPALPHFQLAKVLPISRERLMARLRMLPADDAQVVNQMWKYFAYEQQPMERTDQEMVAFFHTMLREVKQPTLWAIINYGMTQRTLVAALRRRHWGLPAPRPGVVWGGEPWARHIERHWSEADFHLTQIFPWIPEIRGLLESNETLSMERRLKDLAWAYLDMLAGAPAFTFDALLVYVAKWGLLNQWLLHDEDKAAARFQHLTDEILKGKERLFEAPPSE